MTVGGGHLKNHRVSSHPLTNWTSLPRNLAPVSREIWWKLPRVGSRRLVAPIEGQHRRHADDELAAGRDVRGRERRIDVGIPDRFQAITQIAAEPLDPLGEEVAMSVDPDAGVEEVIAELPARLLEDVHVHPPGCAEDEGNPAERVGALRPPRGISARAQALADARAGARAEDVVVAELDEPRARLPHCCSRAPKSRCQGLRSRSVTSTSANGFGGGRSGSMDTASKAANSPSRRCPSSSLSGAGRRPTGTAASAARHPHGRAGARAGGRARSASARPRRCRTRTDGRVVPARCRRGRRPRE